MFMLHMIWLLLLIKHHSSETLSCLRSDIHQSDNPRIILVLDSSYECSNPGSNTDPSAELILANAQQLLAELNRNASFKIDVQVLPGCANNYAILSKELSMSFDAELCQSNLPYSLKPSSKIVAVVGTGSLKESEKLFQAVETLHPITMISYSDYTNTTKYLYTTGTSLQLRAKAMIDLAVRLDWDIATIKHGDSVETEFIVETLKQLAVINSICIIEESDNVNYSKMGVFLVGTTEEIMAQLSKPPNGNPTWIVTIIDRVDTDLTIKGNVYVIRDSITIKDKVSTALELVHISYNIGCSEHDCNDLISTQHNVQEQLQSYAIVPSAPMQLLLGNQDRVFSIHYQGEIIGIFTEENGLNVTLASNLSSHQSLCTTEECGSVCRRKIKTVDHIYIPGDAILLYTAPIHESVNEVDHFTCANFHMSDSIRAEVAVQAVKLLNQQLGTKFGLFAMDSCFSSPTVMKKLTEILTGEHKEKVIALIGDYSSHVTVEIQHLLKPLKLMQISYGASTNVLNDKTAYPYFLRTHPSMTRIAEVIPRMLVELNNANKTNINSYILIQSDSLWGSTGGSAISEGLKANGFCQIGDTVEFNYKGFDDVKKYQDFWHLMATRFKDNKLFIFNGEEIPLKKMLDTLKDDQRLLDWWRQDARFFIVTETWDNKKDLTRKYGDVMMNSFAFELNNTHFKIDRIRELVNAKQPELDDPNPWFRTMYQTLNSCKLRGDFSVTSFETLCSDNQDRGSYELDIYSVFTTIAIFAAGYGLKDYCKDKNLISCINMTRIPSSEEMLLTLKSSIKNILLYNNDKFSGERIFSPFNLLGDGNFGYNVRSIQPTSSDSFEYEAVHVFTFSPSVSNQGPRTIQAVNFYKRGKFSNEPLYNPIVNLCSSCVCSDKALTMAGSKLSSEAKALYAIVPLMAVFLVGTALFLLIRAILKRRRQRETDYNHARKGEGLDVMGTEYLEVNAWNGSNPACVVRGTDNLAVNRD